MSTQRRPDLHNPSHLALVYCTALKARILSTALGPPSWSHSQSEMLKDAAAALLAASTALDARVLAQSQTMLALESDDGHAQRASTIDDGAFKKCFPDLPEDCAQDVLAAYELITTFAPSMTMYPDLLHAEIRHCVELDTFGAERASALLAFEVRLRLRHNPESTDDSLADFCDQLFARLAALRAADGLSEEGFTQLAQMLEEGRSRSRT